MVSFKKVNLTSKFLTRLSKNSSKSTYIAVLENSEVFPMPQQNFPLTTRVN